MSDIEQKRAHVRRARQTRSHTCHWPGCTRQVPPAMWGCRPHWFRLPQGLRDKLWGAYTTGQEEDISLVTGRYLEVAREVRDWITKHGGLST